MTEHIPTDDDGIEASVQRAVISDLDGDLFYPDNEDDRAYFVEHHLTRALTGAEKDVLRIHLRAGKAPWGQLPGWKPTAEMAHRAKLRHGLDAYIKSVVERAPELTPDQVQRLRDALPPVTT